jgi:hydroxymethylpyrimidine/phosphomethylpyrimidine kinase
MLTSASTITALAQHFADISDTRPTIILDPVMISTSGHNLIPPEAVEAIRSDLLPHVDWVTPNIPEAQALAGTELQVESLEGMLRMAMELASTYNVPKILLKGGHLTVRRDEVVALQQRGEYELAGRRRGVLVNWEDGDCVEVLQGYRRLTGIEESGLVVDMLVQHEEAIQLFVGSKIETSSTHGTGCTLSSALACAVIGESDAVACQRAIRYVRAAIAGAFPFGKGHGPLNHSILASPRALPP